MVRNTRNAALSLCTARPRSRVLHSSTSQLSLSRLCHRSTGRIPQKMLTSSRKVDECKPLPRSTGFKSAKGIWISSHFPSTQEGH